MVTTIHGAVDDLTELCSITPHGIATISSTQRVVVGVGHIECHRIPCGEVKDDEVITLDLPEALEAAIRERRLIEVGLMPEDRIVRQGEGHGRHRHTRTIAQLVDEEIITDEKRLLQRRGGDGKVLEEVGEDDRHGEDHEDDILDQTAKEAHSGIGMLTQITPVDPSRKVEVDEERQENQPPPACPAGKGYEKKDEKPALDMAPCALSRSKACYRMRFHSVLYI